jgi:hypothetical protein
MTRDERVPQGSRGQERRRELRPAARAIDDQRGQRRRLTPDEVPLPAESAPLRVEGRLVAEDPARDAPDPGGTYRSGQAPDVRRREARVAVPPQEEVAVPHGTNSIAHAEYLGGEAVARPEPRQRRPRDRQLLVGRRDDRERRVVLEEHLTRPGIDRDGRRAREREVRRPQGLRESRRHVPGRGERRGDDDRREHD